MKIIKLGHLDLTFMCQRCETIYDVSTDEIKTDENMNMYYATCPLCGQKHFFENDDTL